VRRKFSLHKVQEKELIARDTHNNIYKQNISEQIANLKAQEEHKL